MVKGQCNCGEVAFEISSKMTDVYVCHCSICRRSTGSNGIAVVVIDKKDFHRISGEKSIKTWNKPGHDWQSSFCQICGSTLPGENDGTRIYVPVGLIIEGDENLRVVHHIWVGSKANWDQIGDKGKQHKNEFEG